MIFWQLQLSRSCLTCVPCMSLESIHNSVGSLFSTHTCLHEEDATSFTGMSSLLLQTNKESPSRKKYPAGSQCVINFSLGNPGSDSLKLEN